LRPADLVVIDRKGRPVGDGTPSSEIKLHLAIYDARPDCQAVIHAHPITATAFALAGEQIPDDLLPEAAYVLGSVATAPFGAPGTFEVCDRIAPLLQDHKTILMANHGAVVMGRDLLDAFFRMETLERVSRILVLARVLGTPQPLPSAYFASLLSSAIHGRL